MTPSSVSNTMALAKTCPEIANGVSVDLLASGDRLMNETGTAADPQNLSTYFNDLLFVAQ